MMIRIPPWGRSLLMTILVATGVYILLTMLKSGHGATAPPKRVRWANSLVSYEHAQPQRLRPPAPPLRPRTWEPYPPPTYQTIGYLEGDGETRPLLGRRSHTRRHRWHYSSTNDPKSDINALRLPVTSVADNGRKCTEDMGCQELMDGDTVSLPGVTTPMRVHLYERHFG